MFVRELIFIIMFVVGIPMLLIGIRTAKKKEDITGFVVVTVMFGAVFIFCGVVGFLILTTSSVVVIMKDGTAIKDVRAFIRSCGISKGWHNSKQIYFRTKDIACVMQPWEYAEYVLMKKNRENGTSYWYSD